MRETSYYHSENWKVWISNLEEIKGSLKVAIAKRVDLEARIEYEERKLNEIQDPTYSDDQRNVIEDRIKNLGMN